MALNAHARFVADAVTRPLVRGLVALGASADALTIVGVVTVLAGSLVIASGERQLGAVIVAFGAALDALDGGVARARGTQRPFGAFLDSVTDRIADVAVFAAVAWLVRDDSVLFAVTMVGLGAAQVTSYMRAKAEALGWNATVGIIERAERLALILIGIFFTVALPAVLWVLAVGGVVTMAQRWIAVVRQARQA